SPRWPIRIFVNTQVEYEPGNSTVVRFTKTFGSSQTGDAQACPGASVTIQEIGVNLWTAVWISARNGTTLEMKEPELTLLDVKSCHTLSPLTLVVHQRRANSD
ncbi:MAG TPA: hypothetical protein VJU15_14105, partial [Gemmatimonadales bacterium]|nr:hypothetical protein [Gemmatimonadales bacterium]